MSDNIVSRGLTRRQFLKTTAVATALAAVGDRLFGGPVTALAKGEAKAAPTSDVWVPNVCNLCDQNCGLRVRVLNGVVVKVEGEPNHPMSHGKICGRPNTYPMYLYNPYRVKAPMKRTNPEKGLGVDPKWQEITWDEALNTVAEKMKAVRTKDPHRFWLHSGHRSLGDQWSNFGSAFGTTTKLGSVNFCTGGANHMSSVYLQGGAGAHPYMDYTRYQIEVGGRLYGAKGAPEVIRYATRLREQGMKVVEVCPIIPPSMPNPDEWIPIKVGTDAAFCLSMQHVMIYELGADYPGYDVEFLKQRTNGPYLIRPDGFYARAEGTGDKKVKDPTRLNQEFGKPLVWDAVENKPKTYDDPSIKDFALEGTFEVQWKDMAEVECKTGFQMLKDNVKKYTPEYAETITEIPAATIRRITKEFIDTAQIGSTIVLDGQEYRYRPAAYSYSKSYSGSRGWMTQAAMKTVNALIGNTNVPGGWGEGEADLTPNPADGCVTIVDFKYTHVKFPPEFPGLSFDSRTGGGGLYPMTYNMNTLAWYAMDNPEKYWLQHPAEIYAFNGANYLGNSFSPEFIVKQMKKISFIWGTPYHFDDIAEMADVLLPNDTHLDGNLQEFEVGPYCHTEPPATNGVWFQHPVVDRVYNTMNADQILIELAARIGFLNGKGGLNDRMNRKLKDKYKLDLDKKYTWQDVCDRQLQSTYGDGLGNQFFTEKGYKITDSEGPRGLYPDMKWPTSRYRIYVEDLVWARNEWGKDLAKLKAEKGVELRPSNDFVLSYMQPLPSFMPRPYESLPPEYDMYAIHYKTMLHSMTTFMDNPWISEFIQTFDPYTMQIMINTETAAIRGIKSGDQITVESPFGKVTGECVATQMIRPDTVAIAGCMGATSPDLNPVAREGVLFNRLCWAEESWRDPFTGNQENGMKVKVYKKV
jgi:anaerobic selenocysteine-containing dehydrogenase